MSGCADLREPPRSPSAAEVPKGPAAPEAAAALPPSTGATHPTDSESTQANSAPLTSAKPDEPRSAGTASKNEPKNSSLAKARSGSAGTAEGSKMPSTPKGGSATDKGQPRAAGNSAATLGLSDLEQRLRDTHAIGVFTKLSLKNQIDDLLDQLRAYRQKQTGASLPQLRQRYDALLEKVIGLLQSGDASLAKDISSSREAIWSLLTDPAAISKL